MEARIELIKEMVKDAIFDKMIAENAYKQLILLSSYVGISNDEITELYDEVTLEYISLEAEVKKEFRDRLKNGGIGNAWYDY